MDVVRGFTENVSPSCQVGIADVAHKGDTNLKDWIIFKSLQMDVFGEERDNTGLREFREVCVS